MTIDYSSDHNSVVVNRRLLPGCDRKCLVTCTCPKYIFVFARAHAETSLFREQAHVQYVVFRHMGLSRHQLHAKRKEILQYDGDDAGFIAYLRRDVLDPSAPRADKS